MERQKCSGRTRINLDFYGINLHDTLKATFFKLCANRYSEKGSGLRTSIALRKFSDITKNYSSRLVAYSTRLIIK